MKLIPNLSPIDAKAIQELGIPSLLLMEEAGRHVAERVNRLIADQPMAMPVVTVVCGKGNNGGDGFVCARHLAMMGSCRVFVVHAVSPAEMSEDSRQNFERLKPYAVTTISGLMMDRVNEVLHQSDIVIDALFGSGLVRNIEEPYWELIEAINESEALCVAVDLPSGVASATGKVMGIAVEADYTVTFVASKPGLHLFPGRGYAGTVKVADIGIPPALIDADPSRVFLITAPMVRDCLPKRVDPSHKYSYGHVLVIAGSRDMPGAAAMSAEAALRAGAGVVTLAAPLSSVARMHLPPEIMVFSLPETEAGTVAQEALEALIPVMARVSTVALGPGLTHSPSTVQFVEQLLDWLRSSFSGSVVLDADGLNCLAALSPAPGLGERFILTPHLGECSRLLRVDKAGVENDLLLACQQAAEKYQATVVLKSASTVIYDDQRRYWINPTGNPGMATAGSGDILTGFVAGFLAQGLIPDRAARVAVYLHGLAGDKAAEELTQYCLTATDLIRYLPQAIQQVQG